RAHRLFRPRLCGVMDVGCSAFGFLCICAARSFWSCRRRAHRHRTHRRQSWDQELLRYVVQWRVGFVWYVIAIALPFLVSAIALAINSLRTGAPFAIASGTPIPLLLTLAFLVIGEEIGWRGFALPVCKCVQTV